MIKIPLTCGVKFNGTDILQLDPSEVREAINSLPDDQRELVLAIIKSQTEEQMLPPGRDHIPEDYAKEYGRPPISQLPYGRSENDGYSYLPGHAPNCSGPSNSYGRYGCWCKWATKHSRGDVDWDDEDDF